MTLFRAGKPIGVTRWRPPFSCKPFGSCPVMTSYPTGPRASGPNVSVLVVLENVVKSAPTKPGPSSATCGVICGDAVGGGWVTVHPDRVATRGVADPSLTAIVQ